MISKKKIEEITGKIRCEPFLKRTKAGAFICPYCGKSTGPRKNRTFLLFHTKNEFFCTSCGTGGDPITLYQHEVGTDYQTAAAMLAKELKIPTDETFGSPLGSRPPSRLKS